MELRLEFCWPWLSFVRKYAESILSPVQSAMLSKGYTGLTSTFAKFSGIGFPHLRLAAEELFLPTWC